MTESTWPLLFKPKGFILVKMIWVTGRVRSTLISADHFHTDLAIARKLLGPDAIIGVSCSNIPEAHAAAVGGATYLGIGTMFATPTYVQKPLLKELALTSYSKENTKEIIGTAGTRGILEHLSAMTEERPVRLATVAIGGINASNVQQVMYQSKATFKGLDGVAVVSAIMAAENPENAAAELRTLIAANPPFGTAAPSEPKTQDVEELLAKVPGVIKKIIHGNPLCHNMTNLVVQNFAANVALAMYVYLHTSSK